MVERIELTFLGTGSAIPTKRRNHPAMFLKYKNENILIDCGEGTQRQFRKALLNPQKITKILITHWHGDHTLGIPGLLQTMIMNKRGEKLDIYGPKGTKRKLKEMMDVFMGWYLESIGRSFDIVAHEVEEGVVFDDGDFFVEAIRVDHDVPAVAYSFTVREQNRIDKDKLLKLKIPNSPLIGELSKGKTVTIDGKKIDGKKLMYKEEARKIGIVMDTRYSEDIVGFVKGADLLVIEATHSREEQEIALEYGHMTSVDSATVGKKAKVKALALVHLSQRYEGIPKMILKEAEGVFGKGVVVPEDLDRVEL
jgi:ribonuclease Z